jgi:hypothetical protein
MLGFGFGGSAIEVTDEFAEDLGDHVAILAILGLVAVGKRGLGNGHVEERAQFFPAIIFRDV